MPSVCFYFQVHQPERLKRYRIFDIGVDREYFNEGGENNLNNLRILKKVAHKCYLPANNLILRLLERYPGFKVSYSISGVFLDQARRSMPELIESWQRLANTGRVEFIGETYYHSLSFLYSTEEFRSQVRLHSKLIEELFGQTPRVFRNTELIYSNDVAREAEDMGFAAVLAEGADHILEWRSPNFVYRPTGTRKIKLLLKNYKLSDDIAFRFGEKSWKEYPLTAPKFANWVSGHNGSGDVINLFMDYETFGEHQWESTGIFHFLEALPEEIFRHPDNSFVTVSEAAQNHPPIAELNIPHYVSWADVERDLSAWRSNDMQHSALQSVFDLERKVVAANDPALWGDWRRLQTSDHFYYMCTKWFADGDVHKYFNPYESPYEAFISYMNVLHDFSLRLDEAEKTNEHRVPIRKL